MPFSWKCPNGPGEDFRYFQCISPYIYFWKMTRLFIWANWISFTLELSVPSNIEFGSVAREKVVFLLPSMYYGLFTNSLKKRHYPSFDKFQNPQPKDVLQGSNFVEFDSGVLQKEIFNVSNVFCYFPAGVELHLNCLQPRMIFVWKNVKSLQTVEEQQAIRKDFSSGSL